MQTFIIDKFITDKLSAYLIQQDRSTFYTSFCICLLSFSIQSIRQYV